MSVRKVSYFGVFFGFANFPTKQKTAADKRPTFSASRFTAVAMMLFGLLTSTVYAQTITTVAGPGSYDEFGKPIVGDGGPAQLAYIDSPRRIAVAPDGSIYIADLLNNVVRKILPNGIITTYAGTYSPYGGYGGDGGPATSATLNSPNGVALDAAGNLYIADYNNFLIRKVAPDGIITTLIGDRNFGNSPDGSNGTSASIGLISGMAVDSAGNLYISTVQHNQIRKVTPDGYIYTVAGSGSSGFSGDGALAINASLNTPIAVAVDGAGNIFIADFGNNRIRKVNTSGVISTVAGSHSIYGGFGGDGGPATSALLNSPYGIDVDANGSFYIADSLNNRIRKVGADGIISTIAGTGDGTYNGDDIDSVAASLNNPLDVVVMPGGIVFIADTYHGRVRKLTPASPGAPVIGAAVAGHARARVEFTPPARDGGASITGYTLTSFPAGGIDNQAGSIALNHEITGLNNGTAYTFTVTATNVVGTSPASAASNSVTPHPYPGAPFIGTATAGSAQATVTFTAPTDSGSGPITGYTVSSFPAGGVDSHAGSTNLSHVVTGLTNGVTYTFKVVANNADGIGPASASSNSVTPLSVPSAPTINTAVAGNQQANVGLNASANNGGSAITGYTVVSSPAGGIDNNANTTSLNHLITGLNNGTAYTFTAVARNAVGTSAASAPSNVVTPATLPDAPGITNVVAGNAQASLVLTAPANNGGSAITGYTVSSIPAAGIDANAGTTNLNRTITGLANGTSYTFIATATNSAGTSNPSPPSASVNPATVPDAPSMGAASGGDAIATVYFNTPNNDGGRPITGYTVTSFPAGGVDINAGATNLSHQITGLVNGTSYTFSVKATNVMGTSAASALSNAITPVYTPPMLSISNAVAMEGDSGTRTIAFTISLSKPSASVVSFNIATSNGTATAGSDYVAKSLSNQTIAVGATSMAFIVTLNSDTTIEANETFTVTLSNLAGAAAGNMAGLGTILNDDFTGGTISTIAGGLYGDGGPAVNALLGNYSEGIAFDSSGNLYIAETFKYRIRKVTPGGIITTVAGTGEQGFSGDGGAATSAMLNRPHAVAVDASGNIYIGDSGNNRIRKVTPAGIISTIAGNGTYDSTGDGGSSINAALAFPSSIVIGPSNSLYFVDGNTRIRKITSGGVISTIVGNGSYTYGGDGGSALSAGVNPYNIAVDASGNIYITDHTNYRIRKVTAADNIIRTIAGNGVWGHSGDGGPAASAGLDPPYAIGVDSLGNVIFSEYNSDRIRKIDTTGKITTIGGNGYNPCPAPSDLAICANFNDAYGIAISSDQSVYVLSYGSVVNKIDLNGIMTKVAGGGVGKFGGDGGPAVNAILSQNAGVAADNNGNIFIADTNNHRIRKIAADGIISTYAGNGTAGFSGDGFAASLAMLYGPTSISTDASGNLYVLDEGNNRIRKITTDGVIATIAGNGTVGSSAGNLQATAAGIGAKDIAADNAGNVYLAETAYGRVRKVSLDGAITTVAGIGQNGFSGDGGPATSASFRSISGVDVDANGNLFIVDRGNYRIRRVSPNGIIETIAGTGVAGFAGDNGDALLARIQDTYYIKVDQAGNVFLNDFPRIRKISNTGIITTVAGTGTSGFSGDGGLATNAKIYPIDITTDSIGNLYFADSTNHRVRKVTPLVGGATAPAAPTIKLATAGDRSATIEILPPASNGGSAVTGYTVTSFPAGGIDSNAGTAESTHLITGLNNGVEYKFKVTATNAIGSGPASGFSNTIIPLPLLSVSHVSVIEGNSGAHLASFAISLSSPAVSSGASFDVAAANIRSTGNSALANTDYSAMALTRLTIPAGQSSINYTVKIIGDKLIERDEKFAVNISNPGGAIISAGSGIGTILNDDDQSPTTTPDDANSTPVIVADVVGDNDSNEQGGFVSISAIQGRELVSPYLGRQVHTRGVVTALTRDGFFLQSADMLKDANPESSEGIFVYTRSKPEVAKGSLVSVEGKVEEIMLGKGVNQLGVTRISALRYKMISGNHAMPVAIKLGPLDMSPQQSLYWLERFEGMMVSMPRMKVVGPVDALPRAEGAKTVSDGIFYMTTTAVARPFREPGINRLDNAPVIKGIGPAVFDGNPEIIRVDSIGLQGAAKISVDAGDLVSNLSGILNYADGAYTLMPEANAKPIILSRAAPRRASKANPTELVIANFNLGRLFDDQDNPAIQEPVLGGNSYVARLAKTANAICAYANNPDIVAVSEVENFATLSDLASAINSNAGNILSPNQCGDPEYLPYMATGKTGNTHIGFLVSNARKIRGVPRVQVLSVEYLGASARFRNPDGSSEALAEPPVLLAKIRVNLKDGRARLFSVLAADLDPESQTINHEPVRAGWKDAESFLHAKHRAQAVHLATLLQARQTANPAENIVVLGGFNATEFSDGYEDMLGIITGRQLGSDKVLNYTKSPVTRPLTNLTTLMPKNERYSAIRQGNAMALDHVLVNQAVMDSGVTVKAEFLRINADFGADNFDDFTLPIRNSSHDPVVLYLGVEKK